MVWDGDSWEYLATQTTDGHGLATFTPLDPGQHWVVETDGSWCHIESLGLAEGGNWLEVSTGQPTVVFVYNCDGTPGQPGETPTKYPNTGVPPEQGSASRVTAPGAYQLASVSGLLGMALSRRRLMVATAVATGAAGSGAALANGQVIEPVGDDPMDAAEGTPASLCLAEADETCARGPVPAGVRIAAIGVDAPIEILETVQGVMQQPTDEVHVAWYKETARLGETGNLLLAGHVNWWGVPEAVFFGLGTLQAGDEVILSAADGEEYRYAVEWVSQESNLEPPREEVLGMTDHEAVTLITCGGEWNADLSEYEARTVARARRMTAAVGSQVSVQAA